MKIKFREIPEEGLRLAVKDESWFPEEEVVAHGPVGATIFLESKGGERVFLEGQLQTAVTLRCDRCLREYEWSLDDTFAIDLEVAPDWGEEGAEHACGAAEMDTMQLENPEVDINQVLRQQVLLMIPEKRVCAADCRGLCPKCGADLNVAACACDQKAGRSPFEVLASLKKQ